MSCVYTYTERVCSYLNFLPDNCQLLQYFAVGRLVEDMLGVILFEFSVGRLLCGTLLDMGGNLCVHQLLGGSTLSVAPLL